MRYSLQGNICANPTTIGDVWVGETNPMPKSRQIIIFTREEFLSDPAKVIAGANHYGYAAIVDGDKTLMLIGLPVGDDWIRIDAKDVDFARSR